MKKRYSKKLFQIKILKHQFIINQDQREPILHLRLEFNKIHITTRISNQCIIMSLTKAKHRASNLKNKNNHRLTITNNYKNNTNHLKVKEDPDVIHKTDLKIIKIQITIINNIKAIIMATEETSNNKGTYLNPQ